jgi:anti-anti-sigma factor
VKETTPDKSIFIDGAVMLLNTRVRAAMLDTVAIEGRITVNNSDEMRRKLLAALRSRPAQVIVDLSQTTYMDLSGLATLLEAVRIARKQGTQLLLA